MTIALGDQPLGLDQAYRGAHAIHFRFGVQVPQQQIHHLEITDAQLDASLQQPCPEAQFLARCGLAHLLQYGRGFRELVHFPVALGQLQADAIPLG